jgi:two-component system chemotaxis response regulator CheB
MRGKVNILIVDDSAFMRLLLGDILAKDTALEVVGTAANGKEAVQRTLDLKPDVVLLDMIMEEYDGIYAVKEIMRTHPIPILILSAVGNTDLSPIFEALKCGAVDYINKPSRNNAKLRLMEDELIQKIKHAANARPRVMEDAHAGNGEKRLAISESLYDILVIGASTGGPSAVERVLKALPADFPIPVIVAQHMPANFIDPFVHRLDQVCPLQVAKAIPGIFPQPGTVWVAPGNMNIRIKKDGDSGTLQIVEDPKDYPNFNHPSVNALFHSLAAACGEKSIAVIMTGMGKDGVTGIKAVYDAGGYTIAQDEETSVIFGMPKVAIASGAIREILPVFKISSYLCDLVKSTA